MTKMTEDELNRARSQWDAVLAFDGGDAAPRYSAPASLDDVAAWDGGEWNLPPKPSRQ